MKLTDIPNGLTKVITGGDKIDGQDEKMMTTNEARGAVIATNIVNTILTSLYTRKRVEEGKPPVAGFLF